MDKKNDWNLKLSEYIKQGKQNQVEKQKYRNSKRTY